ncbi:hypothetical protein LN042_34245 [Kitasatospora sp. RB6PN24]|nr:hypothetical protein [Kitasatospora humi]MCC9312063.1 hypothetical protein [Kitasatospora humi]
MWTSRSAMGWRPRSSVVTRRARPAWICLVYGPPWRPLPPPLASQPRTEA